MSSLSSCSAVEARSAHSIFLALVTALGPLQRDFQRFVKPKIPGPIDFPIWTTGDLVLANDKWFDYQHHSMLLDLGDEPLVAESD